MRILTKRAPSWIQTRLGERRDGVLGSGSTEWIYGVDLRSGSTEWIYGSTLSRVYTATR